MSRPSDFLHVLENPDAPALTERSADGELLLVMLAHMFFADGDLADGEIQVMRRLVGEKNDDELRAYIKELAARPLEVDRIAAAFVDSGDRDDVVTLAEHGIWGDNQIEMEELEVLDAISSALRVEEK